MNRKSPIQMSLAKELGLSQATISRALRQPGVVKNATRQRILQAFEEQGYQPDELANRFRRGKLDMVGVCISSLIQPYFPLVINAAQRQSAEFGWNLSIECTHDEQVLEHKAIRVMQSLRFTGALVNPHPEAHEFYRQIGKTGFPVVMIDRYLDGVELPYVGTDNRLGARLAVTHLIGLGHRRIAMLYSPQVYTSHRERFEAYTSTMLEHGLKVDSRWTSPGGWNVANGRSAAEWFFALPPAIRPSAVFCDTDSSAVGLIEAFMEAGVQVPKQVSVVGFADFEWVRHTAVPLTTIHQPAASLGQKAVVLLHDMLERPYSERSADHILLAPRLIVRQSTTQFLNTQITCG